MRKTQDGCVNHQQHVRAEGRGADPGVPAAVPPGHEECGAGLSALEGGGGGASLLGLCQVTGDLTYRSLIYMQLCNHFVKHQPFNWSLRIFFFFSSSSDFRLQI